MTTSADTSAAAPSGADESFRHEALLYRGAREFLERTSAFVREGHEAGEPVLVVVSAEKIRALRAALGDAADQAVFADMAEVGSNPARIIPAWQAFVDEHASAPRLRGIGEPISTTRSPAELVECQRHEALLNVAFEGERPWWLLCPYDTEVLDPAVIAEAERTHPFVADHTGHRRSSCCPGVEAFAAPFDASLAPAPARAIVIPFGRDDLVIVRRLVTEQADDARLDDKQTAELVLAIHELAANSVRHGGGRGELTMWREGRTLVCEVADAGHITEPLAGRRQPALDRPDGRGLWLVNQLCDLVQLRSSPTGTVVRVHARPSSVHAR